MFKRISCVALCTVFALGVYAQQVTALDDPSAYEQTISFEETAEQQTETTEEIVGTEPEESSDADSAAPESTRIFVDNEAVENAAAVLFEHTTYVSLRSLTSALRPDAAVNWESDHATITAENLNVTVYPNSSYIVANGRYLYLPYGVRTVNDMLMLPVRVIAQVFDAQVQWNPEDGCTYITSGTGVIVSGEEYYDANTLYWLSHIINAESGNQPLKGKIGVGNVILNRVNSPLFPNTVYDVVFQKNQFTPARTGSINKEPNSESVIAAKLCLDGAQVLPSALWFNRAGVSCWASRNKSCVATIGAHSFYA